MVFKDLGHKGLNKLELNLRYVCPTNVDQMRKYFPTSPEMVTGSFPLSRQFIKLNHANIFTIVFR